MNTKHASSLPTVSTVIWMLVLAVVGGYRGALVFAQQPTAQIVGKIQDSSGAAIADASVDLKNTDTGLTRHVMSGGDGTYVMPSLPVGSYSLKVVAQGFKQFSQSGIVLEVGQTGRVDVPLQIGSVAETIQVSSDALQVDTTSATLRTEIDQKQIQELPLNTRNVLQLVTLVPGVVNATSAGAGSSSLPTTVTNQRNGPTLSVNGSRANASEILLDGTVLTTSLYNRAVNLPNPDSIGEFELLTNSYGAEYGRAAGGVFVAVSKSGTNQFHGSAWEFLRNDALNARNWFAPAPAPKPILKQNQFGAAFGGPIIKDKTFFFVTYEGLRIRQVSLNTFGSLTAAERTGDFSAISTQLTDPSTGLPYPKNQIPSKEFDPMSIGFMNKYLAVADPVTGLVNEQFPLPVTGDQFTAKADQRLSAKDQASFRFFRTNESSPTYFGTDAAYTNFGNLNQGFTVRDTHTFTPNLIAEFGFSDTNLQTQGMPVGGETSPEQLGGSYAQDGSIPIAPLVTIAGNNFVFASYPWLERSSLKQFDAKVSFVHKSHQWTFGIIGLHQTQRLTAQLGTSGIFTFDGSITGNSLADYLIGLPVSFEQQSAFDNTEHTMGYGLFAQDDIKINSKLSLNLGLRYELAAPWTEDGGRSSTVVFNSSYHSTRFPTAAPGFAFAGDPGIPQGLYPMDKRDFAPRVGFAYDVFGDGKTAVRGGYGIFYNAPGAITIANANEAPPFFQTLAFFPNSFSNPYGSTYTNPFPFTFDPNNPVFAYPTEPFAPSPTLKNSYIQQYNVNVQHQFAGDSMLQIGYVGSRGDRLWYEREANAAPYVPGATATNAQSRRPFENQYFAGIAATYPDGYSNYNSLQVTARRRFSKTYSMQLAYTYSKSLDAGSYPDTDNTTVQNPANPFRGEYGLSDFDQRHLIRLNGVWDLPRLDNWGIGRYLVGGWEVAGIVNHSSGVPFSVTTGAQAPWLGASRALGNLRLNTVSNPCVGCGNRNEWANPQAAGGYFNASAFATPPDGQFGASGRNSFIGPSYFDTDLSLAKNFTPLKERKLRIQFRADMFNLFNNVDLNNPVNTNTSSNFGKITSAGPAREIQFALRVEF